MSCQWLSTKRLDSSPAIYEFDEEHICVRVLRSWSSELCDVILSPSNWRMSRVLNLNISRGSFTLIVEAVSFRLCCQIDEYSRRKSGKHTDKQKKYNRNKWKKKKPRPKIFFNESKKESEVWDDARSEKNRRNRSYMTRNTHGKKELEVINENYKKIVYIPLGTHTKHETRQ